MATANETGTHSFAERLAALAAKCDELGLKQQAETTRRWIIPRHAERQYLFLPAASDPAAPKAGAETVVRQWYERFTAIRRNHAAALFDQAKAAAQERQPARAYQLLHEVLRDDLDHAEARRILGYIKSPGGGWVTPERERMAAEHAGADHPKLGWRSRSYWRLQTPHFQIVTNHSAREALEAGRQLEDLHSLWRQIFFRYWSTSEGLAARFAGGREALAPARPKMQVVLLKNREEYAARFAANQPQVAATLGFYQQQERTSYFFAGDTSVYPAWYHEATHQLFQESAAGTVDAPGEKQNFWAIEGAALYMESLAEHDGYWTIGGCESDRLQFARYRALSGEFAMPLQQLAAMGREEIQKSNDIRQLYAHAAGITHFLLDGDAGKHREAFVDLLTAIYQGSDAADSLTKTIGQPLAALDHDYTAFLNVTDEDLKRIPDPARIRNISLGRTAVTDDGLARLAGCKNLAWLDLSLTAVSDSGLKHVAAAGGLKQLFLEGTKISDASLPLIAGLKQLEELDLSKVAITDEGLAAISGLRNLKVLYLTGSPITDAGVANLRGLKQLETLETSGTQVTQEGRQRLRAALPKLKAD